MIPVVLLALFGPLPLHDKKTPSSRHVKLAQLAQQRDEPLTVGLAGASSDVRLMRTDSDKRIDMYYCKNNFLLSCVFLFDLRTKYIPVRVRSWMVEYTRSLIEILRLALVPIP
jgi:hypothetical protein